MELEGGYLGDFPDFGWVYTWFSMGSTQSAFSVSSPRASTLQTEKKLISVNSLHDYFHTVFMLKECKPKIILTFMQFSSKGRHPLH